MTSDTDGKPDPERAPLERRILEQVAEIRGRLDPDVLRRLRWATEGKEPFDRESAREAVKQFLEARGDGGAFKRKLAEILKRQPPCDDTGRPLDG